MIKSFNDFLKEQVLGEEEGYKDFLKNYGLDDEWKNYKNKPKPITAPPEAKGWTLSPQEAMRDIARIVNNAIDSSTKVNKFGIEKITFEVINSENTSTGIKIDLEAQGTASARNSDHIKKQLEKLISNTKGPLSEKGIYLEFLYNKIDTNDSMKESNFDEPAVGLVRKIDFRIICIAIINSSKHKKTED